MAKIREALAHNLKKILKEKGITQSQLSRKTGISMQTISGMLHKKTSGSPDVLATLSKTLHVEETDFFQDPDSIHVNPDLQELIEELNKVTIARRAFLLETWLFEIRELERRSAMREKRSAKIPD